MSKMPFFYIKNTPNFICKINASETELDLSHIKRLTNHVGIAQHAKFATAHYLHGYCIDDNCRALMLCGLANRLHPGSYNDLIDTYLSFILHMQRDNGKFGNFLSFENKFLDEFGTEDAFGRTLWSLGSLMKNDAQAHVQMLIKEIIDKSFPNIFEIKSIRAAAYTLCGLMYMHKSNKYRKDLIPAIYYLADFISAEYEAASNDEWSWFEEIISYDNAIIPYSLMLTKGILPEEKYLQYALESALFLDSILFNGDRLSIIGNDGWYKKNGTKSLSGQQPVEIPSLILMYQQLAELLNAPKYCKKAQIAFNWFHGQNNLKVTLYDKQTKGCRDGIDNQIANQNQGAESSISYWQAYIYLNFEIS